MKLHKLFCRERQDVLLYDGPCGEHLETILPLQTPAPCRGSDGKSGVIEQSVGDAVVTLTRRVPKSSHGVENGRHIRVERQGRPVPVRNRDPAVHLTKKVLVLDQEVSTPHEELAGVGLGAVS